MMPTIVFEGKKPVMTLGAPGGAWIGIAILQALLNVLDWGMSMQEAVSAPRFSATSDVIDISNRIPRATQSALEAMGYEVKRSPLTFPFAAPHGISFWDGELDQGLMSPRDHAWRSSNVVDRVAQLTETLGKQPRVDRTGCPFPSTLSWPDASKSWDKMKSPIRHF